MQRRYTGGAGRYSALASALLVSTALTGAALAQESGEEEITVTAQRKSESIQKVPIAVSAFSTDQLAKSKLDGGPDLVKAIPNVNFSKGNFTGSNFSIRGIGSKLVAASGDSATGVHLNGAPLTANNLFEAEFFDTERVEVLRGPQGTLYGRNATGGVVNVITNKPNFDTVEAMGRFEYGNYNSIKTKAMLNIPLGEMFAIRGAGVYSDRNGFGDNLTTGNDADDRHLYNTRLTLGFQPSETFSAYLLWDHFEENDSRSRIGKQFCSKDVGPANIGGLAFSASPVVANVQRGQFSQGCRATSLYADDALGTINTQATLGGLFGLLGGFQTGDAFAGKMQDPDVRNIESSFDPIYKSKTNIYEFGADWDITDTLRLSALASYTEFDLYTRQDYNRYTPSVSFNATPGFGLLTAVLGAAYDPIYAALFPGGFVPDAQNGTSNQFRTSDISSAFTEQTTAELRLQSSFDGPVNFSFGANYLDFDATGDYYVMFNTGTAFYQVCNAVGGIPTLCASGINIDSNSDPDRSGHNYYDAYSPYHLKSTAIFGEVYWEITDEFKLTGGLRYTDDQKEVENHQVNLGLPGSGVSPAIPGTPDVSKVDFQEFTGRAGFDWQPDFDFTDSTLVYGFYSRGYKSGGLNSPCSGAGGVICGPATFEPEFINSYEIGTKNTLAGGSLQLNLSLFYYDYKGYQVSKIVNRASTNENIDATVKGVEFESAWSPVEGLRFNLNAGYLDSEIKENLSIDTFDRTQGNPNLIVVKSSAASNCVVTIAQAQVAVGTGNPFNLLGLCSGAFQFVDGVAPSDGVLVNLKGNELPNAPEITVSFGAQYSFNVSEDWEMTIRGDYYYQADTYSRIYNSEADKIKSWDNVNFTVTLANESSGWQVDAYLKNAFDEEAITDTYLTDDSSGLFRNAFFTDPRTFGIGVQYSFASDEVVEEVVAPPPPPPVAAKTFIVFFNFDSSELTAEAQTVIGEAAAAYKAGNAVNLRIQVRGHTDTVGSAAYNMPLSERRAASVKSGLVANGVSGTSIDTSGAGFSEPLVPTGPGVKEPQNRRATIDLTGAGA